MEKQVEKVKFQLYRALASALLLCRMQVAKSQNKVCIPNGTFQSNEGRGIGISFFHIPAEFLHLQYNCMSRKSKLPRRAFARGGSGGSAEQV